MMRAVKQEAREMVVSPSMEIIKTKPYKALSNLI